MKPTSPSIGSRTRPAGISCARARSAWAGSPSPAARGRQPRASDRAADDPFAPRPPHFPAKVKNVIFLSMSGGPPHLDLFDYKPELVRRDGQDCPASLTAGKPFAFTGGTPKLQGTPQKFRQHGQSPARGFRPPCRGSPRSPTISPSSSRCLPSSSTTARPSCC